jgi:hypothetical protein
MLVSLWCQLVRLQSVSSQLDGKLHQLSAEKFTVGWLVQKLTTSWLVTAGSNLNGMKWLVTKKGQIKYFSTR